MYRYVPTVRNEVQFKDTVEKMARCCQSFFLLAAAKMKRSLNSIIMQMKRNEKENSNFS